MKILIISFITAILMAPLGIALAQDVPLIITDVEGCKDHSFVTRMPGYIIGMCNEDTSPGTILIDKGNFKLVDVGTRKTDFTYFYMAEMEYENLPTHQEVLEHYKKTTLKTAQLVDLITENSLHGNPVAIYKLAKNKSTYWIIISLGISDEKGDLNEKNQSHHIRIIGIN